jgi:hypothetical protein
MNTEDKAENVEDIISVFSENERMHNGVEMDNSKHGWYNNQGRKNAGKSPLLLREAIDDILHIPDSNID